MCPAILRSAALALALVTGWSVAARTVHAQPFTVQQIPSLPDIGPDQVATGDLDGDGDLDLLISNFEQALDLNMMLRQSDGGYVVHHISIPDLGPLPAASQPYGYPDDFIMRNDVVVGDFDGDGDLDVATSLEVNNTVVVLLRQSDGTYTPGTVATVGDHPRRLLVGDLDGDGDLDLATANARDNTVSILLNTGDGTCIVQPSLTVGAQPMDMVAADLDGDGDLDLATANYGSTTATLLLRQSGGYTVQTISGVGSQRVSIGAGDLDGDGDIDLALINARDGYVGGSTVGILANAGDATFTVGPQISTPNGGFLTIADLDGDTDLDLVTMSSVGGSVAVLLQNNGSFAPTAVPSTGAPYGADVATADLDGDGDLDLIGVGAGDVLCCDGTVNLLFRQPNGSYQARTYGATSGSDRVLVGDMNNDGRLDLVVGPGYENKFQVIRQEAEGYSIEPIDRVAGPYLYIFDMALGDLDGDGDLDLTEVGVESPDAGVDYSIKNLLQQDDGRYATEAVGSVGNAPLPIVVGDLDGDGDLDLVTSTSQTPNPDLVQGWFRGSNGGYTPQTIYQPDRNIEKILLGDLDGDGDLDLVGVGSGQIDLLFRDGSGYLRQSIANPGDLSVSLGDFDGDGDLDLAVVDLYGYGQSDQTVRIYDRQDDGSYLPSVVGTVSYARELVSGDLDGDGDLDLAVVRSDYQVGVLWRQANGSYSQTTYAVQPDYGGTDFLSLHLAISDLDSDGDLDLIVYGWGAIDLLRNDQPTTATVAESRTAASGKSASTSFGETNLTFTGDVTVPAPLSVGFFGHSPAAGALPDSVASVSPFFWHILNTSVSFDSGSVAVPRSALGALSGATHLVWLKRPGPGDPWQSIGGAFVGDNLVSTVPFRSFSEFAVGQLAGDVTLPVELRSFSGSASARGVVLSWQTATEHENAGFIVLRDGVEIAGFRTTAALRGRGTTASPSAYGFTDARVVVGRSYTYRLRSVDVGGQVHELGLPVTVRVESPVEPTVPTEFALHPASPNPFNPTTTVQIDLTEAARVVVTLYDALGRVVRVVQPEVSWSAGAHATAVSADGLPSGLYLIRMTALGVSGRRFTASERALLVR